MISIPALILATASTGVLNCDVLDLVATVPDVDFATQIQPIFDRNFCTDCHPASGGLSLTQGRSYDELFCQPTETLVSPEGSRRVVPREPAQSWLFLRVNCDAPDSNSFRMPLGSVISTSDQGLIRDWIAQGAQPFGGLVFRGGFEDGETCN